MYKQSTYLLLVSFLFLLSVSCIQKTPDVQECVPQEINDPRDFTENIPGETMGQKLESLLFWSQEEKERRFPIMHELYPSILVSGATKSSSLEKIDDITPIWDDTTRSEERRVGKECRSRWLRSQ